MAAQEVPGDSPEEPINSNFKKWTLRVSIHCEGCKKKVKKLLSQVRGVHEIDVDTRQHKLTVIGDVDAATLLQKLIKSGKQAELWPENPFPKEKKPAKAPRKEKEIAPRQESQSPVSASNVKEVKPSPPVKPVVPVPAPPKEIQESSGDGGEALKVVNAGKSTSTPAKGGGTNGKVDAAGSNDVARELSKSEGKNREIISGGAPTPSAEEEKDGESSNNTTTHVPDVVVGKVGVGNDGGTLKKKKSRGQKGNNNKINSTAATKLNEQQSSAAAEHGGTRNLEDAPQNSSLPDHRDRPRTPPMYVHHYPPQYYGPPPAAAPMYATMSYNTAYPTSSYTASYYAPAPPNSYVHSHPGAPPEFQAPPLPDYDLNLTRQPLDSFEMFSDENPNGCLIM